MTKVLRCSDMMPGCDYVARAESEDELMQKAAQHAREKHGMETVPPEVALRLRARYETKKAQWAIHCERRAVCVHPARRIEGNAVAFFFA